MVLDKLEGQGFLHCVETTSAAVSKLLEKDVLKHQWAQHVFLDHKLEPRLVHGQAGRRWRCSRCEHYVCTHGSVWAHKCRKHPTLKVAHMQAAGLIVPHKRANCGRCFLCGWSIASTSTEHACRSVAWRVIIADASAVKANDDSGMSKHLSLSGHVQLLLPGTTACDANTAPNVAARSSRSTTKVVSNHLLIGPCTVLPSEQGLYAINKFTGPAQQNGCGASTIGFYSGHVLAEGEQPAREQLRVMETSCGCKRYRVDPRGAMFKANQGHGCHANMQAYDYKLHDYGTAMFMAGRDIEPGDELLWDYRAETNDPELLKIKCGCGCGGMLMQQPRQT